MKGAANLNLSYEAFTFVVGRETFYALHNGAMVNWEGYTTICATVQNDYKGKCRFIFAVLLFQYYKVLIGNAACFFVWSARLICCLLLEIEVVQKLMDKMATRFPNHG